MMANGDLKEGRVASKARQYFYPAHTRAQNIRPRGLFPARAHSDARHFFFPSNQNNVRDARNMHTRRPATTLHTSFNIYKTRRHRHKRAFLYSLKYQKYYHDNEIMEIYFII